jgi:hypothetical protein
MPQINARLHSIRSLAMVTTSVSIYNSATGTIYGIGPKALLLLTIKTILDAARSPLAESWQNSYAADSEARSRRVARNLPRLTFSKGVSLK